MFHDPIIKCIKQTSTKVDKEMLRYCDATFTNPLLGQLLYEHTKV